MARLRVEDVMCAERLVAGGRSVRQAARDLGVDESTLRYRLGRLRRRAVDGRKRQPEVCAPWARVIKAWLEGQAQLRRPEAVKVLYELLLSEHGYAGSYRSVLRYVRRRRWAPAVRPCRRTEVRPGSQGQVDWVEREVWLESHGGWVKVYGFLLVLSFSRMWAVVWSLSQDFVSWIRCHNEALVFLGGVPWVLRIDNLKTGVSSGAGPWAVVHRGYASYARQLGTEIDPARVRTPTDKGKVERRGRDVVAYLGLETARFQDLEDLQQVSWAKTIERSKQLVHPLLGGSFHEAWQVERPLLVPLPASLPEPFDTQVVREVSMDCMVRFEGREYHVPFELTGRRVEVRGCAGTVEIFHQGEHLVSYPRGTACRRLLRQDFYEGEGTETVLAPTPLGRLGRRIVLERSWEIPLRPIDHYAGLVEAQR
jgi:transposase